MSCFGWKQNVKPEPERFDGAMATEGKAHGKEIADSFYDIATDFYTYGWGDSFHFAPMSANESFKESIVKHEVNLANDIGILF